MAMRLNLGCNDRLLPASDGWINVDLQQGLPEARNGYELQAADLREPWPWPDSSVDEIQALDVIEHLPDRVFTMNELHRVLKPGGVVTIEVPNAAYGAGFIQDPTHVSMWCGNSFQYFRKGSAAHKRFAKAYGIKAAFRFRKLEEFEYQDEYEKVYKLVVELVAVK